MFEAGVYRRREREKRERDGEKERGERERNGERESGK